MISGVLKMSDALTQDKIDQLMAALNESKEEIDMKEFVDFFNEQIFTKESPDGLFVADIKVSPALMEKIFKEY